MYHFSPRSLERLDTCHSDLRRLFNEVIKHRDCTIVCGFRGQEEQDEAYANDRSKVYFPHSKHNRWLSEAIDVMPYPIDWKAIRDIYNFAGFVQGVASQLGIDITWGGTFKTFFDGPHYQLNEKS